MARRSPAKQPPSPKDQAPERVPFDRLHIWQIQAVRDLLWVAAALALLWLGHAMRAVTVPLLVALLLAYLFEPLVARLSARRRLSRPVVVTALLGTVGVAVVAMVALVTPAVVRQTADLIDA
ncbi:MAG: AI-2E family transporter, partial [Planctomycetota bacterium]